jgi:hypothetical protein
VDTEGKDSGLKIKNKITVLSGSSDLRLLSNDLMRCFIHTSTNSPPSSHIFGGERSIPLLWVLFPKHL